MCRSSAKLDSSALSTRADKIDTTGDSLFLPRLTARRARSASPARSLSRCASSTWMCARASTRASAGSWTAREASRDAPQTTAVGRPRRPGNRHREIHAREVIALKRQIEEIIAQHTGQTAQDSLQRHGARLLHDLRASESVRHHRPGHPEPHRDGVAAVASVSAGAHQPEGARRGGKEAAEVACADRDEDASEVQAAEEDLARQVETRHACPAALRGVACSAAST